MNSRVSSLGIPLDYPTNPDALKMELPMEKTHQAGVAKATAERIHYL